MIQIYAADNQNYEFNGDHTLHPLNCTLNQKLNDAWTIELEAINDGSEAFQSIKKDAVLAVPTPRSNKQLFRIYETQKDDYSVVAYALPIFMDAKDEVMLMDTRPTNATGQTALDILTAGTKYSGKSDIVAPHSAEYIRKNLLEAIAGGEENAFLTRWGGEIYYNNFEIQINNSIAVNTGVRVAFGRNMTGIKETVDTSNLVTRIIPIAYNGHMLPEPEPWVDSEIIGNYAVPHTKVVTFDNIKLQEDCKEEGEIGYPTIADLQRALIMACEELYKQGADLPNITYEVDMIDLSTSEEYKDVAELERIHLGDIAHCVNKNLQIETLQEVIELTFDCITKRVTAVTLGDTIQNYFNGIESAVSETLEKIAGQKINEMQYYIDTNKGELDVANNTTAEVFNLLMVAWKTANVEFHGQINLEAFTDQTGDNYDDCRCTITTKRNGIEHAVHPVETYQDGKHILVLTDVFNAQAGSSIQYEVFITSTGGRLKIEPEHAKAYVCGMGLVGELEWDGNLGFTEAIPRLEIPAMATVGNNYTDEVEAVND